MTQTQTDSVYRLGKSSVSVECHDFEINTVFERVNLSF